MIQRSWGQMCEALLALVQSLNFILNSRKIYRGFSAEEGYSLN